MYYRITLIYIIIFLFGCDNSKNPDKLIVDKLIFAKYNLSIPNYTAEYDDSTDEGHRNFLETCFNPKSIFYINNDKLECFISQNNTPLKGYYRSKIQSNNIQIINKLLIDLDYKYCDTISRTEFNGFYCGPTYFLQLYYQNKVKTFRVGYWKYENVNLSNLIDYIDSSDHYSNLHSISYSKIITEVRKTILSYLYLDKTLPRLNHIIKVLPPINKE